MESFRDGATPEEIAQQYPSLPLGDIHEVIGYAARGGSARDERETRESGRNQGAAAEAGAGRRSGELPEWRRFAGSLTRISTKA